MKMNNSVKDHLLKNPVNIATQRCLPASHSHLSFIFQFQVAYITRHYDINFFKSFWLLAENDMLNVSIQNIL